MSRAYPAKVTTKHGKATSEWAQWHIEDILMLPEPGERYEWGDIEERSDTPDPLPQKINDMRNAFKVKNVIQRVGWTQNENGRVSVWQTNEQVYEFAKTIWEQRTEDGTLPKCGHKSGFRTIDANKGIYECLRENCDERYGREVIEEVFF